MSNPAQNVSVSTCQDSSFRDAKCLELLDVSGRLLARKSQGRFDGTRVSPLAHSDPPMAIFQSGLVRKAAGDTDASRHGSSLAKNVSILRVNHATPQGVLPGVRQVSQSGLGCHGAARPGRGGWSGVNRSLDHQRLGCAVVFRKREGAPMRKQYLHLSAYSCDRCNGPVVAGSLAVRENEISKETDIQQVGAICLSCGHRQSKMTKLGMPRQFPPVEWEQQITAGGSHFPTVLEEALNRAT